MTFDETKKIITILHMNYASFLSKDLREAHLKMVLWADALKNTSAGTAEAAAVAVIKTCEFAPTLAEFLRFVRAIEQSTDLTQLRLTQDERPRYTADPEHVDRVFREMMRDLA